MNSQLLNSLGLLLDIGGFAILFFYGFPQPSHEEGVNFGLEDATALNDGRTVAEHNEEIKRRKRKYLFWSWLGFTLVVLGFVLQLVATWM